MGNATFSIAAVSALTGLTKEVLRKWETRYGFPVPERDAVGHRKFSQEQLQRLRMIKTLLDGGLRAHAVVPLTLEQLQAACVSISSVPQSVLRLADTAHLITALQAGDPQEIEAFLNGRLTDLGLRNFILQMVPSINTLVGQAWADGRIGVRNEHLYTERIKSILRHEIAAITVPKTGPRVLLATPPGETHTLGLLLVETLLHLDGADCVPLGAELGADEIVLAAAQYQIDIVALSFSHSFPLKSITSFLKQLRAKLPPATVIWGGGAGVVRLGGVLPGVELITEIDRVAQALRRVCDAMPPKQAPSTSLVPQ